MHYAIVSYNTGIVHCRRGMVGARAANQRNIDSICAKLAAATAALAYLMRNNLTTQACHFSTTTTSAYCFLFLTSYGLSVGNSSQNGATQLHDPCPTRTDPPVVYHSVQVWHWPDADAQLRPSTYLPGLHLSLWPQVSNIQNLNRWRSPAAAQHCAPSKPALTRSLNLT